MIEILTTATFDRLFKKLPKPIQRKTAVRTELFKTNPFHPSLRTEKLHPKHFITPNHAELRYIGHHHSIYDYNLFK